MSPAVTEKKSHKLGALRQEFGSNKIIPLKYEHIILESLSHFPEVKDLAIEFKLRDRHPVPYGTAPSPADIFREPPDRRYTVTILEEAIPPTWHALLKNLPHDAQIGALGHEISHVVQYNTYSKAELAKNLMLYMKPSFRQKMEKAADRLTIEHGLGKELHTHAVYIRSIPGYVEQRKEIDINYLKPEEILLLQNSYMGV